MHTPCPQLTYVQEGTPCLIGESHAIPPLLGCGLAHFYRQPRQPALSKKSNVGFRSICLDHPGPKSNTGKFKSHIHRFRTLSFQMLENRWKTSGSCLQPGTCIERTFHPHTSPRRCQKMRVWSERQLRSVSLDYFQIAR